MKRKRSLQTSAKRTPQRTADWVWWLEQAIATARTREFAWGTHDCCLFPCDAVLAMTGVDLARGIRGRYRSLRGALRILRSAGGLESLAVAIAARHRLAEIAPGLARRGDIVLVDVGTSTAGCYRLELGPGDPSCLAVVGLAGTDALGAGRSGLVEVPMPFWRRAWRIE